MNISIEYCSMWNYLPRAASLANEILEKYDTDVKELTLIPSGGGVFEVIKNGDLIFSKKSLDRFPDDGEVMNLIESG